MLYANFKGIKDKGVIIQNLIPWCGGSLKKHLSTSSFLNGFPFLHTFLITNLAS